jgi:ParB family chromosome partitioning protein
MKIETLQLANIDPPATAHRLEMDDTKLWELADSIRDVGLLNPIIVRPKTDGRYEIIAGHRRYCAHQIMNLTELACIVRESTDAQTEIDRFTENLQRDDLSPMEEAIAVTRLAEETQSDATSIAHRLRRSESWVRQRFELMKLPDELKQCVHTKQLPVSTAIVLARVTDDAHRAYLLDYAIKSGASAGVIRSWVSEWELAAQAGTPDEAAKPIIGAPMQEVIIQIPCYTCHTPTDHREMELVRLCRGCAGEIKRASGG